MCFVKETLLILFERKVLIWFQKAHDSKGRNGDGIQTIRSERGCLMAAFWAYFGGGTNIGGVLGQYWRAACSYV